MKTKKISKSKKIAPRKNFSLELLHHILRHRSTRPLMAGYTVFWMDIEIMIDTEPFCTSCHIFSMNKKARYKNPLKPKANFKIKENST